MTKVVNIRQDKYDEYIGHSGFGKDGYFGNPHVIGFCKLCNRLHDRNDALLEYRKYFYNRIEHDIKFKNKILSLKDKTLGCFCKQKDHDIPCHGDVIIEYIESYEYE